MRVLVGRLELITPAMERDVLALAKKLGDASAEARDEASRGLARYGRFAEPILVRVLASTDDPEVRARIRAIVAR